MNRIKRFIKELKRVKWPSGKVSSKSFSWVLIFIIISSIVIFALSITLGIIWKDLGIK